MPRFWTRDYLGYQIGLRKHDPRRGRPWIRVTLAPEKPGFWPLMTGGDIEFDLVAVSKKRTNIRLNLKYEWRLLSPDGAREFRHGNGTMQLIPEATMLTEILKLGHFSEAQQYRLDMQLSNDNSPETTSATLDFHVLDWDVVSWEFVRTFITVVCTSIITTILIKMFGG